MRLAHNKIPPDIEKKIIDLYINHNMPRVISKMLNISKSAIHVILRRNNIATRFKICQTEVLEKRCLQCLNIYSIDFFGNNKGYKQTGKTSICKNCSRQNLKIYRAKNIEKIRERNRNLARKWRKENKQYKIAQNLRRRIREIINSKKSSSSELLGCDINYFLIYLESQFQPGMNWENYGNKVNQWNMDHIKPCDSFDLTSAEEQKECFHYTNIRPLWASENFIKGNKI